MKTLRTLAVAALPLFALGTVRAQTPTAPAPAGSVRARVATSLVPNASTPNGEIASAVDSAGAVHLVYAQASGDVEDLYYTKVTGSTVAARVRVTNLGLHRVRFPHVAVSSDGVVHVAFWIARKADATKTGNYAVEYARGGATGFTVEQVSDNAADPAVNAPSKWSAYVNDRPQVFFDAAGAPVVEYLSWHVDGPQGNGNYVVFATRTGGGWSREQAFMTKPHHSVEQGISVPSRWLSTRQVAYFDIDKYQPHLVTFGEGRWNDQIVSGPSGFTNLDDVSFDYDAKNVGHLSWVAKKDKLFVHATVNGASVGPLDKIAIQRAPWSNFSPTAVDPLTQRVYFLYEDVLADDDRHRIVAPGSSGFHEVSIPTFGDVPGVIRGHGAFHVRNGRAYVVTASTKAATIFVTQLTP